MQSRIQSLGASIGFLSLGFVSLTSIQAQEPSKATAAEKAASNDKPLSNEETTSKIDSSTSTAPDWVRRARRLLEIGGEARTSSEQKTNAYKELASLKPAEGDDPRMIFAFVLVAMTEKQWPSARKHCSELLKTHPDYVPARAAHARILLITDQKLPAIAELESLAKGLASPASIVSPEQLASAAAYLGLAVGYLEGPGKESVKATSLKELVAASERLPLPLREPFAEARSIIGEEHRILNEKGEEALKELRDGLKNNAEQMRADLESKREKTLKEADAAKQRLESSWSQSKRAWDAAWSQCQSLSQNVASLQSQQGQWVLNLQRLKPPRVDENGNVDRIEERRYLNEKWRLENTIRDLDNQINQASLQYNLARNNGILAENQMNVLRVQAQRLGMTLAAQSGSFAKMDQMIRGKEQLAQKATPKSSATKLRYARAYNTYDDFNYYKEQSLLFDSFPKE